MPSAYDFMDEGEEQEPQTGYWGIPKPPSAYACDQCRQPIRFANVLYMGRILDSAFMLGYVCICTEYKTLMERRFKVEREAMKRLLGGLRPQLPYRASPGPYMRLSDEAEKRLQVFAFDLDGIVGVDDLLLYMDGPRHT